MYSRSHNRNGHTTHLAGAYINAAHEGNFTDNTANLVERLQVPTMKRQPFGTTEQQEAKEIELFLQEYNLIEPGGPWRASTHRDRPDFIITSESNFEERAVELTSVYLDDKSVGRDHVRRVRGPIAIPYDARKVERYKARIIRAVEKKCRSFAEGFGGRTAILSVYLNEYIAIHLSQADLLELFNIHLPRVAGRGPFNQIVLWGGCPGTPVIFHRDRCS